MIRTKKKPSRYGGRGLSENIFTKFPEKISDQLCKDKTNVTKAFIGEKHGLMVDGKQRACKANFMGQYGPWW